MVPFKDVVKTKPATLLTIQNIQQLHHGRHRQMRFRDDHRQFGRRQRRVHEKRPHFFLFRSQQIANGPFCM